MASTDRVIGFTSDEGIKAPVLVESTANLTLSGEQTVNGVAVVDGDRVLVKNQTATTENGIYIVKANAAWVRAKDFDGTRDVRKGTLVPLANGDVYRLTTADTVDIGTNNLTFSRSLVGSLTGMPVVTDIDALKALDSTSTTRAFVTGYYDEGDGGGGHYWHDTSDTTSSDNGGSIIVGTDGARWKLIWYNFISVKQFGAKGDNVTDDRTAIMNCISYIQDTASLKGARVYFPTGVYISSDNIKVTQPGITLYGDGGHIGDIFGQCENIELFGSVIKLKDSASLTEHPDNSGDYPFIWFQYQGTDTGARWGGGLEDLVIYGNRRATGTANPSSGSATANNSRGIGVYCEGIRNARFSNLTISHWAEEGCKTVTGTFGHVIDGQDETSYDNSPTSEGTFAGGSGHAVSDVITVTDGVTVTVDAVSTGAVTQFTVDNSGQVGTIQDGDTLSQTGTTGSGTGFSLTLDGDNIAGFKSFGGSYFGDCEFTANAGDGLRLSGGDNRIEGCSFGYNGLTGCFMNGGKSLTNCTSWDNFAHGYSVASDDVSFVGCHGYDNYDAGFHVGANYERIVISGCVAQDNGKDTLETDLERAGVYVNGPSSVMISVISGNKQESGGDATTSTAVTDGAITDASGSTGKIKSAAGNLTTAVVGDTIAVTTGFANGVNNTKLEVTAVNTVNEDYSVTDLNGGTLVNESGASITHWNVGSGQRYGVYVQDNASDVEVQRVIEGDVANGVAPRLVQGQVVTYNSGAGTIPVSIYSKTIMLVTGGAEALEIADGKFEGQEVEIFMKTDGGNGTLEPDADSNIAVGTSIVFSEVGASVTLKWVDSKWYVKAESSWGIAIT